VSYQVTREVVKHALDGASDHAGNWIVRVVVYVDGSLSSWAQRQGKRSDAHGLIGRASSNGDMDGREVRSRSNPAEPDLDGVLNALEGRTEYQRLAKNNRR
jgi:hypothetical protein